MPDPKSGASVTACLHPSPAHGRGVAFTIQRSRPRIFPVTVRQAMLLAFAMPLVLCIRLSLWLLPFRVVLAIPSRMPRLSGEKKQPEGRDIHQDRSAYAAAAVDPIPGIAWSLPQWHARRVGWAIRTASRWIPCATCLTQALAAQTFLSALGIPATLRIGVAPRENGGLDAHAWLEAESLIIIGGGTHDKFVPFPSLETRKP